MGIVMKIVKGNFEDLKEEMRKFHADVKKNIKSLEKVRKENKYLNEIELRKMKSLQTLERLYNPSKVLPIKISDMIVDYKSLTAFLKKIEKIPHSIVFEGDSLIVQYQINTQISGNMKLYDLSKYYRDFQNIPVGEEQ